MVTVTTPFLKSDQDMTYYNGYRDALMDILAGFDPIQLEREANQREGDAMGAMFAAYQKDYPVIGSCACHCGCKTDLREGEAVTMNLGSLVRVCYRCLDKCFPELLNTESPGDDPFCDDDNEVAA